MWGSPQEFKKGSRTETIARFDRHGEKAVVPFPHQPEDQPVRNTRKPLGQKLQQIVVGSEVENQRNVSLAGHFLSYPIIVRHRLAASLVLQRKLPPAPIHRDLDHSVVLLGIAKGCELVQGTNFRGGDPTRGDIGVEQRQVNVVQLDGVEEVIRAAVLAWLGRCHQVFLQALEFLGSLGSERVDGSAAKPSCPPPLDQAVAYQPANPPGERLPAALVGAEPHELAQLGMSDVIRAKNLPQEGVVLRGTEVNRPFPVTHSAISPRRESVQALPAGAPRPPASGYIPLGRPPPGREPP